MTLGGDPAGGAMTAATPRELMTVLLARELQDGWTVCVGARSTVPAAACMLAQVMHAPDLTVLSGGIYVNPRRLVPLAAGLDCRADSVGDFVDVHLQSERGVDAIFHSGLQIDRWGNINLHWIDRPDGRFRGPGVANTTFGHTAGRTLLWLERHESRTLVADVDFVSIAGLRVRGRTRAELGLPHLGPALLVTPAVVFAAEDDELVARSVHDTGGWDLVRSRTGWDLPSDPPPPTVAPTCAELTTLRSTVDPAGLLREGSL